MVEAHERERKQRMERQRIFIDDILSNENMNRAYKQVIKNKGAAGIDGMECNDLLSHLKVNGHQLRESIRNQSYKPMPVKRVEIPKDNGSKRKLGIPTVTDRMIQQAAAQVLTPIYERKFHTNSYGFRPGKSAQQAVLKAAEYMNEGYNWVVDIDLEKFFDTVEHDKMISILNKEIKDGKTLSLIRKFLVSGVMVGEQMEETEIGTPQGGNLSPLLSNIMLNELDQELEARGLNFVRYADDCLILVKSEKAAKRVMKSMTKYLEETLGLKVNVTKSKVERPSGIKFLGFGFFWDKNAYQFKAKPHQISIMRVKEKLKRLTRRSWSVSFDYRLKKLKQLIIGWVNYFKIAKMRTVCGNLDKNIRFRLRMCIWKQWKKVQTKYRSLMRLGIDKDKAWEWANTRKGYARVARSFILCRTITNERLKRRGLVSLLDHYQTVHI